MVALHLTFLTNTPEDSTTGPESERKTAADVWKITTDSSNAVGANVSAPIIPRLLRRGSRRWEDELCVAVAKRNS